MRRREVAEATRRFDREVIVSWEETSRLRGVEAENAKLRAEVQELSTIALTVGQLRGSPLSSPQRQPRHRPSPQQPPPPPRAPR